MKGLSSDKTMLLNKDDLIRIKGTLKRAYTKTGHQKELEDPTGTYKGLETLVDKWDTDATARNLLILCLHASRNIAVQRECQGIVDAAIKEIDAYEAYRGR